MRVEKIGQANSNWIVMREKYVNGYEVYPSVFCLMKPA